MDTTINGAFFLDQNSGQTYHVLTAADPTHFVTTGSVQLDNLTGDAFDLIRWGGNGIAFRMAKDFWGNGSGRVISLDGYLFCHRFLYRILRRRVPPCPLTAPWLQAGIPG